MSIATALTALAGDISAARAAVTAKGGTPTADGGSSQLAADIATIPAGGGDYDDLLYFVNREFFDLPDNSDYYVPSSITAIPPYFFQSYGNVNCAVHLPDSITELKEYAFNNAWNLATQRYGEIYMQDGIVSIGRYCFENDRYLTIKSFPSTLEQIGERCFKACGTLQPNSFPPSLRLPLIKTIGREAFYGGNRFADNSKMYIGPQCTSIYTNAITTSNTITIYVAQPEDALPGAPWGAQNATIIWNWDGETYYDD